MQDRYLTSAIVDDLHDHKMVFVGGPRQVGKTTLAATLVARHFSKTVLLNWDNQKDRRIIMASAWPADTSLIVLDELHKYRRWKSFIKGEFDVLKERYAFMLTGSARLDTFRRGGDSLQGRYHYYRLHPFSLAELEGHKPGLEPFAELPIPRKFAASTYAQLEKYGGFPEPFLKQSPRFHRRWHLEKLERMFREDIADLTVIRDLGNLKLLSDLLPTRVGSLLSTNSLREDLEVSFKAAARWLDVLESFYYFFRVYPHTHKGLRGLKKEPKAYLWDWSEVAEPGPRFENLIAVHLLKLVHYLRDYDGQRAELRFVRDLTKRELDFLVTIDDKPWFAVEAKLSDTVPAMSLKHLRDAYRIPYCYQVVGTTGIDTLIQGIRVVSADRLLLALV